MGSITLLTGGIESGKTSLCLEVVEAAREEGVLLGGLISPAVFQNGEKVAIDVMDIKRGERMRLADGPGGRATDVETKHWAFYPEAVAWGNQVLASAVPCNLLVIDELGPLEFKRKEGWVNGFKTVASGDYHAALLVIRPSLLEEALSRWQVGKIVNLDEPHQDLRTGKELYRSLLGGRF